MGCLWQDLRFGIRVLGRNRGFTAIAVAALAIGIGATSAIFSVIYGVLLKPLPYRDPDRLVRVYENNPTERFEKFPLSPADFLDYRAQSGVFQDIATYTRQDQQYGGEHPERLTSVRVSRGFFRMFGVQPMLGRDFTEEEESTCCATESAIVSYSFWKRLLDGDRHAIGRKIELSGDRFYVIGVMPKGFENVSGGYKLPHGDAVDVWLPFNVLGNPRGVSRSFHYCNTVAKLKPGVGMATAEAEMRVIAVRLAAEHPADKGWGASLTPLQDDLVGKARPTLLILAGAAGFVLLIACVNVANLLLARATVREREMAIRAAVGASRARLVLQMCTESLTLAAMGGALGLLLAWGGVRILVSLGPEQVPRLQSIGLDPWVVAVTAGASLLSGLAFGLAPALASTNLRRSRPRGVFVVVEVALTFVLLIGAGLLLRSFVAIGRVDPGFRARGVLTMNTSLSYSKLTGARKYTAFYERFVEALSRLPGVTAAGAASNLPWTGANDNSLFGIDGRPRPRDASMNARYSSVSPDYLRSIGVPLLAGRWFTTADHFDAPKTVLLNKTMALQYWPSAEACLGQRIYTVKDAGSFAASSIDSTMTIVGVVGDVKDGPTDAQAPAAFYEALLQNPSFSNDVALRTAGDVASLIPAAREVARQMGNDLSIQEIRPMEQVMAAAVETQRFVLELVGLFAVAALALALIGIYGVMSYSASRRAREIAIRSALGAQPLDTLRLMMGQGMRWIVAGLVAGGLAAAGLTRVLTGMLFQVSATDPVTFGAVAAALTAVAMAACFAPSRKLLRIDPAEALRRE